MIKHLFNILLLYLVSSSLSFSYVSCEGEFKSSKATCTCTLNVEKDKTSINCREECIKCFKSKSKNLETKEQKVGFDYIFKFRTINSQGKTISAKDGPCPTWCGSFSTSEKDALKAK